MQGLRKSVTASHPSVHTPDYSPLLHNSILAFVITRYPHLCSSASRSTIGSPLRIEVAQRTYNPAATFAERARSLIESEASRPDVSTAKGLMLLGSYHSANEYQSLGWLYEGMGVRMAQTCGLPCHGRANVSTVGLNADCTTLVNRGVMSTSMKELRDRSLWTIYIQDQ